MINIKKTETVNSVHMAFGDEGNTIKIQGSCYKPISQILDLILKSVTSVSRKD